MADHFVQTLEALSEEDFVRIVGPIFEHSPWVAHETWKQRPFASEEQLLKKLKITVSLASFEKQLQLIRAHPDLAGRLAQQGKLTAESMEEQASAGLDRLTPDEVKSFQNYNARYKNRFGFPFIICAKLADKELMLSEFERRLTLSPEDEIQTALDEINKIACLRLTQLSEKKS